MTKHPYDDLAAYALGDLDRAAAEEVARHADACPTCAAVLADSIRGVAALAGVGVTRAGVKASYPWSRKNRERWMLGAATAAAVLLGAWNVEMRATAPSIPVDAIVHSHFTHHPLTGGQGSAKLIQSLDGSWIYLVADGLRPLRSYELIVDGTVAGDVRADLAGRVTAYWTRPAEKITSAELRGADGAPLRWADK